MSGYDRIVATPPAPLSDEERARRMAQLPNPGAIALLDLDDRVTGRSWRADVTLPIVGDLGGWTQNGDVHFADEETHATFARRSAEVGVRVARVYPRPEIEWGCAA